VPDDERTERTFVGKFVLVRVNQNGHHLVVVVDSRQVLLELSSLLFHDELALELLLETHDHVHAVTRLLVIDEDVLGLTRVLSQADDAAKDTLTRHVNAIDLLIYLQAHSFLSSIGGWVPRIRKHLRWVISVAGVGIKLKE